MRLKIAALAAGLLVGASSVAMAADGVYVSGELGASALSNATFNNAKVKYSPNWGVLGALGYAFGPIRVEGELGYRDNDLRTIGGAAARGDTSAFSTFVNGYYDIPTGTQWTPYLGVGLGHVWLSANKWTVAPNALWTKGSDDVWGAQGIAGLAYNINPNLAVKADYRYMATQDANYGRSATLVPSGSTHSAYASQTIMVGFTYKFGYEPPPPPPAPVVAPPPPPAPMPMAAPAPKPVLPSKYMVFFDFDKADITKEAAAIIDKAAADAKAGRKTRIDLTGHTDTTGPDAYNMRLSLKRANAVKTELIKRGIASDGIAVVGKGFHDLLVKTRDGVREPQNRRVEIVLP